MTQYQCNVCSKMFGSFNDAALCHPDVNIIENVPVQPNNNPGICQCGYMAKYPICTKCGRIFPKREFINHCNPVNGIHAPFCTGHDTEIDEIDGDRPCPACGGEVGHRINCKYGIAFSDSGDDIK